MTRNLLAPCALVALIALAAAPPSLAQEAAPKAAPSPGEIVAAAPAGDWVDIAATDLLVMTLAPDARGKPRAVYLQLIGAPFSQDWVSNIRTLARAHWYDSLAVVRVQDNYVVQWGDPEGEEKDAKPLPDGLRPTSEVDYSVNAGAVEQKATGTKGRRSDDYDPDFFINHWWQNGAINAGEDDWHPGDSYAPMTLPLFGWPLATDFAHVWPVHCYGMVGVGRGMSPDAGTGAELYTVIGHAPRHLDRNIALVGRIVEGMEHLSSLPRGTGALGFYEEPEMRAPIVSIRLASDLPDAERPHFQFLSTESDAFARYADARANRRDPFFLVPAGGADICNIPVPIRRKP